MLVPLGTMDAIPPVISILGFHVRSTVPFGFSRARFVRGTPFTETKTPETTILPSSWMAASSMEKVDVDNFKSGSVAGEVCAVAGAIRKRTVPTNTDSMHATRQ